MEKIHNIDGQKMNYYFKHPIDVIFKFFQNVDHFANLHKPFLTQLKCINGKNSLDSEGSIFSYTWKNLFDACFKIEEVILTETYKMIHMNYYSYEPSVYRFYMKYKFYWISTEKRTLFCYEIKFENTRSFTLAELNLDHNEKTELMKNWVKYFKTNCVELTQTESIILNSHIDNVWSIVTDFKKFHKIVPILADSVEVEDKIIKFHHNDKICVYVNIKCEKNINNGLYVLRLVNNDSKIEVDLLFKLIFISLKKCLIIFTHKFDKEISFEKLKFLSTKKRNILKYLKKVCDRNI